jgi:NDP-sugar pyrophosphorylase family protein
MGKRRHGRNLSIIIPSAGMGRRMKSYGPKPLIEISGRETVIGRQVRLLRAEFPLAEVVVAVGYESDRIMRGVPDGVRIVENELYECTNVARSIGMALRVALRPDVLIVYGDLVFTASALSGFAAGCSSVLVDSCGRMGADEVGVMAVRGSVTHMSYGLPVKWGQMCYLTGRELDVFRKSVLNPDTNRKLGFEVLNRVIDAGGRIRAVEPSDFRLVEIDTSQDIDEARRIDEEPR